MLAPALADPDPVLIFENALLYNDSAEIDDALTLDIDRAAIRREGDDLSLITYGGSLGKALVAAERLEERQSDWAYSKPVVVLDMMWNFAFVVVTAVVLVLSYRESPSMPLRQPGCSGFRSRASRSCATRSSRAVGS